MNCIKCHKYTDLEYHSDNNNVIYLCDNCFSDNDQKELTKYRNAIEIIRREFGKLMNLAETASITNKNKLPLKVRKQSIFLRDCLKEFRKASLDHEKYLKKQTQNLDDYLKRSNM